MSQLSDDKCVIIVRTDLNAGIVANAAACLGFSLGSAMPQQMGPPQTDADGTLHGGLLNIPLPILSATDNEIKTITDNAYSLDGLSVYDMSNVAQSSKTQSEYAATLSGTPNADLQYWAVAIYGNKKLVNKLSGGLRLYGR